MSLATRLSGFFLPASAWCSAVLSVTLYLLLCALLSGTSTSPLMTVVDVRSASADVDRVGLSGNPRPAANQEPAFPRRPGPLGSHRRGGEVVDQSWKDIRQDDSCPNPGSQPGGRTRP